MTAPTGAQVKTTPPACPREILVIHHSHTDVGYTERQGRVARWHADFIRQAVRAAAVDEGRPSGFAWVCETFWAVERFLESASAREVDAPSGRELPCQLSPTPTGGEYAVSLQLAGLESRYIEIIAAAEWSFSVAEAGAERAPHSDSGALNGLAPGVLMEHQDSGVLATPHVRIEWRPGDGIVSWVDASTGRDLLRRDRAHAPFSLVRELTPVPERSSRLGPL
jgi:hypothetical protein